MKGSQSHAVVDSCNIETNPLILKWLRDRTKVVPTVVIGCVIAKVYAEKDVRLQLEKLPYITNLPIRRTSKYEAGALTTSLTKSIGRHVWDH